MSLEVQQMFSAIARRYDLANDVLSFGIHRLWRRDALSLVGDLKGKNVLDICAGTGDMAFALEDLVGETGKVWAIDFVREMLMLARAKRRSRVTFLQGDALALPFESGSFDVATIAFGIRNVDNIRACLSEIRRVLKDQGTLVVLEFGTPTRAGFRGLYRFYSMFLMPLIGALLTGNRAAYTYLPRTSRLFPAGVQFAEILAEEQFTALKQKAFFSGVAYVYTGKKLQSQLKVRGAA